MMTQQRILELCEHRGENLWVIIMETWVPSFTSLFLHCIYWLMHKYSRVESLSPTWYHHSLVHPLARRQWTQCGLLHLRMLCCDLGAHHFCPLPSSAGLFIVWTTACCFAPGVRGKMPIVSWHPEEQLICLSLIWSCEFQLHTDC